MFEYYKFMEVDDLYKSGKFDEAKALLLELQAKYINSCDENAVIRLKLREMEDILFLSRNLVSDGLNYWLVNDNIKQGPYCKSCYDQKSIFILLENKNGVWHCASCAKEYVEKNKIIIEKNSRSANIIHFNQHSN